MCLGEPARSEGRWSQNGVTFPEGNKLQDGATTAFAGWSGIGFWGHNRYYDPELGRFTQTDPMGYADSMNLYQAFNQSPQNFGDPMGLFEGSGFEIEPLVEAKLRQEGNIELANELEQERRSRLPRMWETFRPSPDVMFKEARQWFGKLFFGKRSAAQRAQALVGLVGFSILTVGEVIDVIPDPSDVLTKKLTREGAETIAQKTLVKEIIDELPIGAASKWKKVETPWKRLAHQRSDIDWDIVRPEGTELAGMTNWQAARKGYSPGRYNPNTGKWENIILHHGGQDPRGAVFELWRSTHGSVPHQMNPPGPWRKEHPDWATAWKNEQSAYWRWRTGAYSPEPTDKLYLPGDLP